MRRAALLLALATSPGWVLPACKREQKRPSATETTGQASSFAATRPECRPGLSRDDVLRLQAEVNRGVDPCPGLASPKIALDHQGLTLDGALLAPAAAVPNLSGSTTADNAAFKATLRAPTQKFPSLDTDLVGRRQLWKMLHPADTFAPLVDLTAPPDTAAAQVASVIRSVAWAGFDKFHLRSGDILVDFRYALPRPAGAAVDAIVHVRATGSFRDMTKVIQSKVLDPDTSVAFDAVP